MSEGEIIELALNGIKQIPGTDATTSRIQSLELDALVHLTWGQAQYTFNAVIRNELRTVQLHLLEDTATRNRPFLLVAYRLFPGMKQQLREAGINYLEANGNAFIHQDGLHVDIDRYPTLTEQKKEANRAFTKTGLKVVFQLLLDKQLLAAPQRTIAAAADVALGNIPHVMEGLLTIGSVVRKNRGYAWVDRQELFQNWVHGYNTTLRPALRKGRYSMNETVSWQNLAIRNEQTCWGGEPAADFYTRYLRPEQLILYTKDTAQQLIVGYHLKPHDKGELVAYEKFWPQPAQVQFAPPLLVYADLVSTSDKRNLETAQMLLDEHLQNI